MNLSDLLMTVSKAVRNETMQQGWKLTDEKLSEMLGEMMPDDASMMVLKADHVAALIKALVAISHVDDLEASAIADDALESYRNALCIAATPQLH